MTGGPFASPLDYALDDQKRDNWYQSNAGGFFDPVTGNTSGPVNVQNLTKDPTGRPWSDKSNFGGVPKSATEPTLDTLAAGGMNHLQHWMIGQRGPLVNQNAVFGTPSRANNSLSRQRRLYGSPHSAAAADDGQGYTAGGMPQSQAQNDYWANIESNRNTAGWGNNSQYDG